MSKLALVRESVELPVMQSVKSLVFCAHDPLGHHVKWCELAKKWQLHNEDRFLRERGSLVAALSDLERVSRTSAEFFTIFTTSYA